MRTGFWEPHSSSIDFCEPNYLISFNIAEFHNTWSSLLIAGFGVVGYMWGNPLKERCISVMFLILFIVGIGSAGLHSTLHWFPQSSDEIPMLWQTLSFLYILVSCKFPELSKSNMLGVAFFTIAAFQTFLYYTFQQVYAVFIVTMIIYAVIVILWSGNIAYFHRSEQFYWVIWSSAFICFVLLGFVLWIIDMNLCASLLPFYYGISGFTLHVFWHFFAGLGTYYLASFFTLIRIRHLQKTPEMKWFLGFLPIFSVRSKEL